MDNAQPATSDTAEPGALRFRMEQQRRTRPAVCAGPPTQAGFVEYAPVSAQTGVQPPRVKVDVGASRVALHHRLPPRRIPPRFDPSPADKSLVL